MQHLKYSTLLCANTKPSAPVYFVHSLMLQSNVTPYIHRDDGLNLTIVSEPIADLGMSSFIRYRRLQMPRMGNANFKREKIRSEREILDRLFPNWGVYNSNKPCLINRRNIEKNVLESESDRDSLGGCTSSDESTSMSHRRLDHPPSENESGNNSDSAIDPGSSSDSEKTSDLSSLSETISRISISSGDSAIDDKVSRKYGYNIVY